MRRESICTPLHMLSRPLLSARNRIATGHEKPPALCQTRANAGFTPISATTSLGASLLRLVVRMYCLRIQASSPPQFHSQLGGMRWVSAPLNGQSSGAASHGNQPQHPISIARFAIGPAFGKQARATGTLLGKTLTACHFGIYRQRAIQLHPVTGMQQGGCGAHPPPNATDPTVLHRQASGLQRIGNCGGGWQMQAALLHFTRRRRMAHADVQRGCACRCSLLSHTRLQHA